MATICPALAFATHERALHRERRGLRMMRLGFMAEAAADFDHAASDWGRLDMAERAALLRMAANLCRARSS